MLPSILYQPTEYDFKTGANVRRYVQHIVTSGSGAAVQHIFPEVPPNLVLVLKLLGYGAGFALATPTESIRNINVSIFNTGNAVIALLHTRQVSTTAGLGVEQNLTQDCEVMVMPSERIVITVNKSAALESLALWAFIAGYLMPRANIQSG